MIMKMTVPYSLGADKSQTTQVNGVWEENTNFQRMIEHGKRET